MTTPEKKIVTPTVGRKVWFRPNGVKNLQQANVLERLETEPYILGDQPLDATVVFAWGDRMVNLAIQDHCGHNFVATSVPLLQEGDEKPASGFYCEWMPYQTARAHKESAGTANGYRQTTHREELERELVRGAADRIAHVPETATSISKGIKTALDELAPIKGEGPQIATNIPAAAFRADPEKFGVVAIDARKEYDFGSGHRVTPADIEAEIAAEYTTTLDKAFAGCPLLEGMDRVTVAVIVLKNGTKLVGVNYGAIDPARHYPVMGAKEARAAAFEQAWPLLGFRLRDALAEQAQS